MFRVPSRSFITYIHQSQQGWRLTLGKNPVQLSPGIHLQIPIIHTVEKVDMRERAITISKLNSYTHDNVPVVVSGSLFFRINNSYDACFNVENYEQAVKAVGTSTIRSIIGTKEYDKIISARNVINEDLRVIIGNSISKWGLESTKFEIQEFSPSNREIERQLEQQMEAERHRRRQILDTEAQVNVAEGRSRSLVLESQGTLEARKNQTDGEVYNQRCLAEAAQYAVETETKAISDQFEKLSPSFSSPKDVANFLLEMKRLTHLSNIASNSGNKVYFIPPDRAYPMVLGDSSPLPNVSK